VCLGHFGQSGPNFQVVSNKRIIFSAASLDVIVVH
jgi:hypothetical protein